MGCDIHVCTEKIINGEWFNVDNWQLNPYFGDEIWEPKYHLRDIYYDRNYELFALLAGVRDYEGVTPIDDPRGVPDDVHEATRGEIDRWGEDGHSHSWFTLRELFLYWESGDSKVKRSGYVSKAEAELLEKSGITPRNWCKGTTDTSKVWVEWTDDYNPLDELMKAMIDKYKDVFWRRWLEGEKLREMIMDEGDLFRIVFWFDN